MRKWIVVVAVASLTLGHAAQAGAAVGANDDPDDAATPLDLKSVSNSSDATNVTLTAETFEAFADADANFAWSLDTDGDGEIDFDITADFEGGALVAAITAGDQDVGKATVARLTTSSISVTFARSLIGNPIAYTYAVATAVDTDGDGQPSDDEIDTAGDFTDGDVAFRVAGDNRVATAVAASADLFDDQEAGAVVLARADTFPDALAGTPLAVAEDGPLLLTAGDALDSTAEAELKRVLAPGKTVHLLGGTAALSDAVATTVQADGFTVERHAGNDRYETALQVADALGEPSQLFLTTGTDFPDALAAGAAAAAGSGAVLLTQGDTLPASVSAYLDAHADLPRFGVGGPAARALPAATALAGSDRYETARLVADRFFADADQVGVASGVNFPDALGGGVNIGLLGGPLLLTGPDSLAPPAAAYLTAKKDTITDATVFGGEAAVSAAVRSAVEAAIN